MGHWSEELVDQLVLKVGGKLDHDVIRRIVLMAGHEIETMSGRAYHPPRQTSVVFEPNGLPFVNVPDMHVGSAESGRPVWPIPDPVHPHLAHAMQLLPLDFARAGVAPVTEALQAAGGRVAHASLQGWLTREFLLHRLGHFVQPGLWPNLFRRVMNPALRFYVPIFGVEDGGWWIQVSRRLLWVTPQTEDEGQLIELLLQEQVDGQPIPLAAGEPILIAAPMNSQPVRWAFIARLWPQVNRQMRRTWRNLAPAVHGHGIPIITIDESSTAEEIACQIVLKAYWHKYIGAGEPGLADVITRAYPKQVALIQRKTHTPRPSAAAAMLMEQLIQPGFDPAQGAEATRRYVRRKASIVVMEHDKQESPERYPWTQIGITERRYYKLLPLFAEKVNGRYDIDYDTIVERMKDHLNGKDNDTEKRRAALALLQYRGFSRDAARKWLQRHPLEQALNARPRGAQPDNESSPV
ncbi:MAG TPA: hypothetical protein DGG94_22310 [Micromonosporaceae bacterium]|nr:hypothetical protein [Micromonosporaceae bacterium]HCU52492.1 hypothetical protein [Micromonosporaceae bacterium]